MKTLALSIVAAGLALAALPVATAQAACSSTFTVTGTATNVWMVDGEENPTLTACPGQETTFNIEIEGGTHNFVVQNVDGAPTATDPLGEGDTETYTFTAPASGSGTYICTIHPQTMLGTVNFAETATDNGGNGGESNDSPGFGVLALALAGIGAALILRRK